MLSRAFSRRCFSSARCLRIHTTQALPSRPTGCLQSCTPTQRLHSTRLPSTRTFSTTTARSSDFDSAIVEQKMEEITDLYGTARDEFEIAAEETAKKTVYAEDDRSAAREELEKLKEAYKHVVEGNDKGVAEEVKRRVGNRVRELESAVVAMEEAALEE